MLYELWLREPRELIGTAPSLKEMRALAVDNFIGDEERTLGLNFHNGSATVIINGRIIADIVRI